MFMNMDGWNGPSRERMPLGTMDNLDKYTVNEKFSMQKKRIRKNNKALDTLTIAQWIIADSSSLPRSIISMTFLSYIEAAPGFRGFIILKIMMWIFHKR